ncbi:hypothetical protein MTR67_007834 [Solanum verrucosum]|uniref:Reverse transcriptase domain-containing protein n=1 Tax=Solanum verrucosum TaxID=315347 RepID=A0AAF0Q6U3_SOLVR|nr:hypothetical protein MTR67_007834 [Solanum verrucosum]
MIQDQRILEEEEIVSKLALTAEFEEVAKKEETAWRQRSRAVWLKQGDRNTSFFHKTANAHRRVNTIDKIKVRDELLTEPAEIQKEITEYYEKLYAETEDWRPDLEMIGCPTIDEDDNNQLMAPFEAQEILEGIKACAGDKAPGPDGFSMAFFSQCWEVIKKEVVAAVQNFHEEGVFEKSINATFVTLIPKKTGAVELNDFRPISLVGGVYKIIAKLLAERLKKVIHKLVDRQQMAFIKNRQIMDAVLIANESVDFRERDKKPGILCKLDIQKAYDHLNWNFLMNLLQRMGFGT